ncbi:LysR substrate-binding domain-containing protein [Paracoccus sanguinis]|uniref:LysR family transcriptional regulator n=1 Tax=Paracoccus sanguinis TaxID=1545044 RepID=A0A099GKJ9_9RHOB|nr:LysR substrate-binding domain-containing protein [Paracoccus sanguinis]KGJ22653.1 LysR family transcriptional regulator [Paracoccus sanguinis]
MPRLRRSLPSLSALATFEAAARLGSFTLAAAELGVTQAAVSRQIKALEADLNTALFQRAHRRVELTAPGTALAATVAQAFARMAEMVETIRQPPAGDTVAVRTTLAFSQFCILPDLAAFRAAHPDIRLRLIADDSTADPFRDRLDVAILYGRPPFPGGRSVARRPDEVFPVCSPALLSRLGIEAATADLTRLPLICAESVNPSWLTWRAWGRGAGLTADLGPASDRSRLRFNHYTDTVMAAEAGEGVALGWATLLARQLAAGTLVRVGRATMTAEDSYHILVPEARAPTPAAQAFIDWIGRGFAP